ncbi:unnamed protein product [Allacma fusca]|uniref:Uncharacterized protein n=1 Tax=Allacma fusca TaxID=39272 RepID=A0A8J2L3Z1_9HEXA|nr:unnamed protein product [Allacma fusca]
MPTRDLASFNLPELCLAVGVVAADADAEVVARVRVAAGVGVGTLVVAIAASLVDAPSDFDVHAIVARTAVLADAVTAVVVVVAVDAGDVEDAAAANIVYFLNIHDLAAYRICHMF